MRSRSLLARLLNTLKSGAVPILLVLALGVAGYRTFGPHGVRVGSSASLLQLAKWTGPLLWSSAAIGVAVMGFLQLFKPELRASFHRGALKRWLSLDGKLSPEANLLLSSSFLAGDRSGALLELPIEQLAAQIQAAADVELGSKPYPAMATPAAGGLMNDQNVADAYLILRGVLSEKAIGPIGVMESSGERGRLSVLVQRRLDELQIQVRHSWKKLLRAASLTLSFIFAAVVAGILGLWHANWLGTTFLVVLLSLLGAFFASVARDLIAVVERFRT